MHEFEVEAQTPKRKGFLVYNDMWEAKFPSMASKLVFMSLWKFANREDNTAYPSVQTLAKLSECSERTVQRALKELEDAGYITRQMRKSTTLYTVMDQLFIHSSGDKMTGQSDFSGDKLTPDKLTPDKLTPKTRQIDTQEVTEWQDKGVTVTPKHNHLTEPNNMTSEQQDELAAADHPYSPYTEWQRLISTQLSGLQTTMIKEWREAGLQDATIIMAIEKAAFMGDRRKAFAYVKKVCESWLAAGIYTPEQAANERKPQKAAAGESVPLKNFDDLSEQNKKIVEMLRIYGDSMGLPKESQWLKAYV